jgi:hypothetical protein
MTGEDGLPDLEDGRFRVDDQPVEIEH